MIGLLLIMKLRCCHLAIKISSTHSIISFRSVKNKYFLLIYPTKLIYSLALIKSKFYSILIIYIMSKPIKIYNPKVATLIAVTFIFTVVLNYLYEKPLYLLGVDIIRGMQAHRNLFHDTFFLLVTMLIDPSIVVLAIVALLVLSKNKKKAFLMTLFVIFNTYCAAILKAYHIDPRPIWTHYGVKNIGLYCPI